MSSLQSDVLLFENMSSYFEQDNMLEDLLAYYAALEGGCKLNDRGPEKSQEKASPASTRENNIQENKDKRTVKEGRKKASSAGQNIQENKEETKGGSDSDKFKKIIHRDIERQRRQEMAGLYASLKSLLPAESIKRKRSISDHMHQATNYITNMQKKIDELKIKREQLRKLCNSPSTAAANAEDPNMNMSDSQPASVKVNLCRDELEILITSRIDKAFPLSKVLADLLGRGLNVISSITARAEESYLHKIQIEVYDLTTIDPSELEERVVNVIKFA